MSPRLAVSNLVDGRYQRPVATGTPLGSRIGVDWVLVIVTLALCAMGLVAVFSASHLDAETGLYTYAVVKKQMLWFGISIPIAIMAWRVDYHRLLSAHRVLYAVNLGLLLAVLVFTHHEVKGAQRWIDLGSFRLQPSEFAKLVLILTLSAFLSVHYEEIRSLKTVLLSLVHVGIPALVIFKQPDLGTALVLGCIWLVITFISGAQVRHIVGILLVLGLFFSLLWMGGGVKQYQKDRFRVFLDASADPRGVGYHITQALNAIGSGQIWGKGLLHGQQGQLGYIPEQHTDFIFTIVGEETGFIGSSLLVILFGIFLFRGCLIAYSAADTEGRLVASGIVGMFLYHVVVNLGMTIGIMPVTGVPLPFMSYGGSSMMVNLAAVGVLQSVRASQLRLPL